MQKSQLIKFFDQKAKDSQKWIDKNKYYYDDLVKICSFLIPDKSNILELGCGNGYGIQLIPTFVVCFIIFSWHIFKFIQNHLDNLYAAYRA